MPPQRMTKGFQSLSEVSIKRERNHHLGYYNLMLSYKKPENFQQQSQTLLQSKQMIS